MKDSQMHTLFKKNVDPFGLFKHLKRKERERENTTLAG